MPTFDVVSELDEHEVTNAVDQANRELTQRFDFKDVAARFELKEFVVTVHAEALSSHHAVLPYITVHILPPSLHSSAILKMKL